MIGCYLKPHLGHLHVVKLTTEDIDRLHDLRHFMATQMLAAAVPIATVSQKLNHARASTTLNVYAHAIPGDRTAAEVLAGILSVTPDEELSDKRDPSER